MLSEIAKLLKRMLVWKFFRLIFIEFPQNFNGSLACGELFHVHGSIIFPPTTQYKNKHNSKLFVFADRGKLFGQQMNGH